MLGDVAVVQEVARGLLHAARAALDLEVVRLAGADRLRVESLRGRQRDRRFVEAGVLVVVRLVGVRVGAPAIAAAVQVEDVEELRAGVHQADLRGIAQVAARHRRRRVAERVRVVGVRLETIEAVDAEAVHERLAAVVERARCRPVRGRRRILDRERPRRIQGRGRDDELLVADLVVQQVALAERLLAVTGDDRGFPAPTEGKLLTCVGVEIARALRLDGEHAEQAVRDGVAVARAGTDVVGALEFRVVGHVVAVEPGRAVVRERRGCVLADRVT